MVSSRTLLVATFLATVHFIQAMDNQLSAGRSSSPNSKYRTIEQSKLSAAARAHAAEIATTLTQQQTYNVGLLKYFLNDKTIKSAQRLNHFGALIKDLDTHIRGASRSSNKFLYLNELQHLRSQAEKHIEHIQRESLAAHNAASARAPRLKAGKLGNAHRSIPKSSLLPVPPAQQPCAVALPTVANIHAAAPLPQQGKKAQKPSSIQAVHMKGA